MRILDAHERHAATLEQQTAALRAFTCLPAVVLASGNADGRFNKGYFNRSAEPAGGRAVSRARAAFTAQVSPACQFGRCDRSSNGAQESAKSLRRAAVRVSGGRGGGGLPASESTRIRDVGSSAIGSRARFSAISAHARN